MICSCSALELLACRPQGVGARAEPLRPPQRDRHAHEIVQRATRPDRHARCVRSNLRRRAVQAGMHPLFEPFAIALRRRIVAHALGRQPADAERRLVAHRKPGRVADHELDAAAADVDAEGRRRIDDHARATAANTSRASSIPLMTSISTPVSASIRSTSSLPLAAVRIALVAFAMTSRAPSASARRSHRRTAATAARRTPRGCGRAARRRRRGATFPSRGQRE